MSEHKQYRYASGEVSSVGKPVEVARCHDGSCVLVTHKTLTHLFGELITPKQVAKDMRLTDSLGTTVYVPLNRVKTWETVLTTKPTEGRRSWAPRV
jgi:hypothetical protein